MFPGYKRNCYLSLKFSQIQKEEEEREWDETMQRKSFNQGLWRERGRGEERKMLSRVSNFRFSRLRGGVRYIHEIRPRRERALAEGSITSCPDILGCCHIKINLAAQGHQVDEGCYGLNCVPPKFIGQSPKPQCDGIWK